MGGNKILVDVHFLFDDEISLKKAHAIATMLEMKMEKLLDLPVEVVSHLEPREEHDAIHHTLLGRDG